ncbi:MAG: hypothetical protein ACPG4K_08555, partial [Haloferula sp.]
MATILILITPLKGEIMGWKVPLSHFTSQVWPALSIPDHRIPELTKPPTESRFFEQGDRLYDVSEIVAGLMYENEIRNDEDPFDPPKVVAEKLTARCRCQWVVWNERSQMLVAEGDPIQVLMLNEVLRINSLPARVEASLTLNPTGEDPELIRISGRSGEKFEGKSRRLRLQVAPGLSADRSVADIQFAVDYMRPNGETFSVSSAITIAPTSPTTIAAWMEGDSGWSMDISWTCFTTYGVPFDEVRWIETGEKLETCQSYRDRFRNIHLGAQEIDGLMVRAFDVVPDLAYRLTGTHEDPPDPFLPDKLPSALLGKVSPNLVDMRKLLRANGVKFDHPSSLAIHSPLTSLLIVVNDAENLDLVEQIVGYPRHGMPANVGI